MKKTLYVVDDQPQVLELAVLILQMIDPEWVVTGFPDPLKALEAVKAHGPDLLLSDQLMPGMEGSQLLENVRAVSPRTIRIIMSGHVPLDKLTLITSAHQYLAKPFNTSALQALIKRSFSAQNRLHDTGLQTVVTGLRSIPSLPQVHHSLLQELEDESTASGAIAGLIADDPGLSLKVLHLANSPLFGRGELVTKPVEAVMCLGTDMISAIVMSQSLFRHYEAVQRPEMDLQRVWTHSWETARLAQQICRDQGLRAKAGEEAFLAGLMHEIGRFLLFDNFPDEFKAACEQALRNKTPLGASLRQVCQAGPAQVGAYILELWGLPDGVISAIAELDDPQAHPGKGFTLGAALYIADHVTCRRFAPDIFPLEDWKPGYLKAMNCEQQVPVWEQFFAQTPGERSRT